MINDNSDSFKVVDRSILERTSFSIKIKVSSKTERKEKDRVGGGVGSRRSLRRYLIKSLSNHPEKQTKITEYKEGFR